MSNYNGTELEPGVRTYVNLSDYNTVTPSVNVDAVTGNGLTLIVEYYDNAAADFVTLVEIQVDAAEPIIDAPATIPAGAKQGPTWLRVMKSSGAQGDGASIHTVAATLS